VIYYFLIRYYSHFAHNLSKTNIMLNDDPSMSGYMYIFKRNKWLRFFCALEDEKYISFYNNQQDKEELQLPETAIHLDKIVEVTIAINNEVPEIIDLPPKSLKKRFASLLPIRHKSAQYKLSRPEGITCIKIIEMGGRSHLITCKDTELFDRWQRYILPFGKSKFNFAKFGVSSLLHSISMPEYHSKHNASSL